MNPVIPLLSAILGAILAQFLSHFYTRKREIKKEQKIAFQEYVTPILNKVLLFYETETHYRKDHDVEKFIDREKLLEELESKIHFASIKTQSSLLDYQNSISFFDGKGFTSEANFYKLFFWYLDDVIDLLEKIDNLESSIIDRIYLIQKKFAIWSILTNQKGMNAIEIIKNQWIWNDDFFNYWNIHKLKILLEIDYYPKSPKQNLIDSIRDEFIRAQTSDENQYLIKLVSNNHD